MSDNPETPAPQPDKAPAPETSRDGAADLGSIPPLKPGQLRRGLLLGLLVLLILAVLDRMTLLLVPPQYRAIPDNRRYHELYYSQKIAGFDSAKKDLRLVILGDSRTRHGIDPALFASRKDQPDITAFNLAPASSGVEFTDLLVREYLETLPHLDTIVWGTSPRIFNRYWEDPVYPLFTASKGYANDVESRRVGWSADGVAAGIKLGFDRGMSALFATYAHRAILKAKVVDALSPSGAAKHFTVEPPMPMNPFGFMEFPQSRDVNFSDPSAVQGFLDSVQNGRFQLAAGRWQEFKNIVRVLQRRNIKLLCFIPPMHTSLARSPAGDADGTPDADYQSLVAKLKALESEYDNFRFIDINNGGNNGFADSDFGDWDHLNLAGVKRLTGMIDEAVRTAFLSKPATAASATLTAPTATATQDHAAGTSPQPHPKTGPTDNTPPKLTSHLGDLDYAIRAYPPDTRPTFWVAYSDDESGVDTSTVRFFINGEDVTAQCQITPTRVSYTPAKSLTAPKLHQFKVTLSDKAGNKAELVWEILLKPC